MELLLKRVFVSGPFADMPKWTIGKLSCLGVTLCDTLESLEVITRQHPDADDVRLIRRAGAIAIPPGSYQVRTDIVSAQYVLSPYMRAICGGCVPRLMSVPGFTSALIRPGNCLTDGDGSILVGVYTGRGWLSQSRSKWEQLMRMMQNASEMGEQITIQVEPTPVDEAESMAEMNR